MASSVESGFEGELQTRSQTLAEGLVCQTPWAVVVYRRVSLVYALSDRPRVGRVSVRM